MNRELDALRYLLAPGDSFWNWGDAGDVVEWRRGGTIVFREQLRQSLMQYANRNLPPLDLVLLVLAACRDSWKLMSSWLLAEGSPFRSSARPTPKEWWKLAVESLHRVHELPYRLRTSPAEVATMIEIVLERTPDSGQPANPVLELLGRPRWLEDLTLPDPLIRPAGARINELRSFMHGLSRLTAEGIETRLKTGLDRLPTPIEIQPDVEEEEDARTVRQLLDELVDDKEYSALVRLVRTLTAALSLPRDLEEPDDLQQGGVSDISNRGTLDRLLLSELVHDDDTLTARIALNEALYLRRESPPANPRRQLLMLIDAGIRMWGLPRLCAAAVGLCLASQDEGTDPARVFRSSSHGLLATDFTTREGLVEHLATLDHLAHPALVLKSWMSDPAAADAHRIFISTEDVLADREFRMALEESGALPCFIATVNRTGKVRLVERTRMGERLLRELWVDLDEVSGAKKRLAESLIDNAVDRRVPAILKLEAFPLRQTTSHLDTTSFVVFPRGQPGLYHLLQVARDLRLMLWDLPNHGARQLTDRLPTGRCLWSGQLDRQGTSLIIGTPHPPRATLITIVEESEQLIEQPLNVGDEGIAGAGHHLGMLFVATNRTIHAIDPRSGERLHSLPIPSGMKYLSGRYFRDAHGLHAAGFDGQVVRLEELLNCYRHGFNIASVLGIMGTPDRPMAVLRTGEVFDVIQRTRHQVADSWVQCRIAAVSHDGNRFVIRKDDPSHGQKGHVVNLRPTPASVPLIHGDVYSQVMPRCWGNPSQKSLFVHPSRLSYTRDSLAIVTNKDRRFTFVTRQHGPRYRIVLQAGKSESPHNFKDSTLFQDCAAPNGVGYKLKEVRWPDGSRVVLDSRGMLHLQSSDPAIPELTLVMHESDVAAWCADGGVWCSDYFMNEALPTHRLTSPDSVMSVLQKFLRHLPT